MAVADANVLEQLANLAAKGARVVVSVTVLPPEEPKGDARLTLDEAALLARTSVGVLREAVRVGALPASGGQRDRSVTRADVDKWIARRAVRVEAKDDADIAARVARMAAGKAAKKGRA